MDRIGHEGVRFRNAFCTNALCAPARATALTGLCSRSSGALSNGIRTDRYKLIHYTMDPQEYEMYDLLHDPEEKLNLYGDAQHAELQQHLWDRMVVLQQAVPERPKIKKPVA